MATIRSGVPPSSCHNLNWHDRSNDFSELRCTLDVGRPLNFSLFLSIWRHSWTHKYLHIYIYFVAIKGGIVTDRQKKKLFINLRGARVRQVQWRVKTWSHNFGSLGGVDGAVKKKVEDGEEEFTTCLVWTESRVLTIVDTGWSAAARRAETEGRNWKKARTRISTKRHQPLTTAMMITTTTCQSTYLLRTWFWSACRRDTRSNEEKEQKRTNVRFWYDKICILCSELTIFMLEL